MVAQEEEQEEKKEEEEEEEVRASRWTRKGKTTWRNWKRT